MGVNLEGVVWLMSYDIQGEISSQLQGFAASLLGSLILLQIIYCFGQVQY